MGIPSPVTFPPGPTWILVNWDNPLGLPVIGQFDPMLQESRGKPIWNTRPGIMGAMPWIKFVGNEVSQVSFEFFALATTILDQFPLAAWLRLNELAQYDSSLGRPPRVLFTHGLMIYEGFLTEIPEAPMEYWGGHDIIKSRLIRQIGPVRITITRIPKETTEISLFTNYATATADTKYEDLAKSQYGDARYGQSLAVYNQGVQTEDKIEMPRLASGVIEKDQAIAGFLDDPIDGL